VQKFGKLGESEVITPRNICTDMVNLISEEALRAVLENGHKILDIAGKAGEFALALCNRYAKMGYAAEVLKNTICTIPTSGLTYEFTRMVYDILGLNTDCIAAKFTSYSLLNVNDEDTQEIDYEKIRLLLSQEKPFNEIEMSDEVTEGDEKVKFDVVVGNPPYQEGDGGAQKSAGPIYNLFVDCSKVIAQQYVSLIIPSRWFAGGKGKELDEFRNSMLNDVHIQELHDYLHPEEVFPDTNNRGGVCCFFRNKNYNNTVDKTRVVSHLGNNETYTCMRYLKTRDLNIYLRNSKAIEILDKVLVNGAESLSDNISAAKAFGFRTFFIRDPKFRNSSVGLGDPIICYGRSGKTGYVERSEVNTHEAWVDKWKVFVPESNNIGTELNDDNQNSFVGRPMTICTETFLVIGADLDLNEESATNLSNYLRTKFARFLLSLAKISQHGTSKTYRFVPVQDFSRSWTDADLYAKYRLTTDEIAFIEATIKPME